MPREATQPSIPCSPPSCWRRRQMRRSYEGQSERRMRVVCVERARAPPPPRGHGWSRSTCGCIFFYLILFNLNLWALHYPPFTFFWLFAHLFVCWFVLFCFVVVWILLPNNHLFTGKLIGKFDAPIPLYFVCTKKTNVQAKKEFLIRQM